jgi:beta-lactamase class A
MHGAEGWTNIARLLDAIADIARGFSGRLGVAAYHLGTGAAVEYDARRRFPTASTIKLPILLEGFRELERGGRTRSEQFTLMDADKVAGTGVLGEFDAGLEPTFIDLLRLMTVVSDNTATNVVIHALGIGRVNALLRELGISDTELLRPITFELEDGRIPNIGLGTPADFAQLLRRLASNEVLSPSATAEVLAILRKQHYRDFIPRYLPVLSSDRFLASESRGVWVAGKPGMLPGVRNDVAIVGRDGPAYVLAVMTESCSDLSMGADNEGALTVARVSRAVFDEFLPG